MEYGICLHSVIPLKAEPSHRSEMVTQALFGELYRIIDHEKSWKRVKLSFDDYEGWIENRQIHPVGSEEYLRLFHANTMVTLDLVQLLSNETRQTLIPVVTGSSLPGFKDSRFKVGDFFFYYDGMTSCNLQKNDLSQLHDAQRLREQLLKDAMLFMNAPYLWGGRTPFGIDCSGFVQMAYKLQGLTLLRDASQQASQGEMVSLLAEAFPGDLAFFDEPSGNITHVGILIDSQHIIHCSGSVRIDPVDHEGIFDTRIQEYTHKLRLIKRMI